VVGTASAVAQVAGVPGSSVRNCRMAMTLPPATLMRVAKGEQLGPVALNYR
jgi:hypothetical protein